MIRMMTVALMLAALALPAAQAQDVDSLWAQAVSDYTEENYQAALDGFAAIEEAGYVSPALYYNMGNCCYKLGHRVGLSILYYEKALKLDPAYEDAAVNLEIAREQTLDRIEAVPLRTLPGPAQDGLRPGGGGPRLHGGFHCICLQPALGRRGLGRGGGDGPGEQCQEFSRLYRPVSLHPARGDEGLRGGQPRRVVPHRAVGRTAGMAAGQ